MAQRETMACHSCGKQVEIVPAGTSKKTGKQYDAFYICGHCNFNGNPAMAAQPQKPSAALVKLEQIAEQLALLIEMVNGLEKKVDFVMTDKA